MIALVLLEWSSLSHSCGPWGSGLGSDFPFCGVVPGPRFIEKETELQHGIRIQF